MRLRNSLIRVRDKGALIATPARSHLADRGSKTAEIEARKGKVTPRNKAISAQSCITSYRDFGVKYPEKWCFQGTWCEANSVPWKSRLAASPVRRQRRGMAAGWPSLMGGEGRALS